ncbi:MAG: TIGR03960 family B12-binding radical SAM protein [Propionibacteriaceae bacterium]|jgi:radical SAM family uncharacterized protein|nr:TIGR03960 family B12-binding radical SAM protein [Propionibacteriaceae bacterium]
MSDPAAGVWGELEPLLAQVVRPVQYVGGEVNAVQKPWESARVRLALMYPDTYAVGQPNQGLAILYEILNEPEWLLAERTFTVWPDLAALMRAHGVPQFTWESHRPVRDFDVLGVSFGTELGYTNLLETLDLAGIPLWQRDRVGEPLVVGGGHAMFNPEPVAPFLDAVVLGDGEEAALELARRVRDWKAAGSPGGRDELLLRLSQGGLAYIPSFYDVSYREDGQIASIRPNREGVPSSVGKHTLSDLDRWPYPKRPVVPIAETVHERYSVEIFRGCTRGCRFCQAGMITRPVRERSLVAIQQMVAGGLAATGLDEVGLLSLSSADHSQIRELATALVGQYQGSQISLSLPSTRVDAFNLTLAEQLSRSGRRTGLTFAPEGGSQRLRAVINKMVTEDDLLRTVTTAFESGWRSVKLYFMCGLPTETDADMVAIAELAGKVIEVGRQVSGRRDVGCTISIGGFVPKPHTSFQWASQASAETVDHRLQVLKEAVMADRRHGRAINLRWASGKPGVVEGLLSRGDRRLAPVIERVWRGGGVFDGWREHFSYERWESACAAELEPLGLDIGWYTTRERQREEVLPWSHLEAGLDPDWLWQDWQDALVAAEVEDCRWAGCNDCGVCPLFGLDIQLAKEAS